METPQKLAALVPYTGVPFTLKEIMDAFHNGTPIGGCFIVSVVLGCESGGTSYLKKIELLHISTRMQIIMDEYGNIIASLP